MTREKLAENLFEVACLAQSERMLTDREKQRGEKPDARKVAPTFDKLFDNAKAHYLAMADYVLQVGKFN